MAQPATRVLVGVAAVVSGLVLGLVVVALVGGGGEPAPYTPFFAGLEDRVVAGIQRDGPVLYPDPSGGSKAFFLDLEGGEIVALHAVPPGADDCVVQYDREARGLVDCALNPVDRATLRRFRVTTRVDDEGREGVFVDLREILPAPADEAVTP